MECDRARDLIGAYRDGELPSDERLEVAAHLETCKTCRDIAADDERIGRLLREQGRVVVPVGLQARVQTLLQHAELQERLSSVEVRSASSAHLPGRSRVDAWAKQAASIAAACVLSIAATWWVLSGIGQADRIEREILNAHIRSLIQETTVQVASSDQHTVRPWFAGRLDFAPMVKDLKAEGFPLIGGRLDYIGERRVGVLVYKRNLHVINVFLWPSAASAESAPRQITRNGYNLLSWSRGGVSYWAISDLNTAELEQLQRSL
jgi:anti-sigma factor RsiW